MCSQYKWTPPSFTDGPAAHAINSIAEIRQRDSTPPGFFSTRPTCMQPTGKWGFGFRCPANRRMQRWWKLMSPSKRTPPLSQRVWESVWTSSAVTDSSAAPIQEVRESLWVYIAWRWGCSWSCSQAGPIGESRGKDTSSAYTHFSAPPHIILNCRREEKYGALMEADIRKKIQQLYSKTSSHLAFTRDRCLFVLVFLSSCVLCRFSCVSKRSAKLKKHKAPLSHFTSSPAETSVSHLHYACLAAILSRPLHVLKQLANHNREGQRANQSRLGFIWSKELNPVYLVHQEDFFKPQDQTEDGEGAFSSTLPQWQLWI